MRYHSVTVHKTTLHSFVQQQTQYQQPTTVVTSAYYPNTKPERAIHSVNDIWPIPHIVSETYTEAVFSVH